MVHGALYGVHTISKGPFSLAPMQESPSHILRRRPFPRRAQAAEVGFNRIIHGWTNYSTAFNATEA